MSFSTLTTNQGLIPTSLLGNGSGPAPPPPPPPGTGIYQILGTNGIVASAPDTNGNVVLSTSLLLPFIGNWENTTLQSFTTTGSYTLTFPTEVYNDTQYYTFDGDTITILQDGVYKVDYDLLIKGNGSNTNSGIPSYGVFSLALNDIQWNSEYYELTDIVESYQFSSSFLVVVSQGQNNQVSLQVVLTNPSINVGVDVLRSSISIKFVDFA